MSNQKPLPDSVSNNSECLSFYMGGQMFGIMVENIQDVLSDYRISRVPLARREVLGSINLRGRIVTAIDLRNALELPDDNANDDERPPVSIVVYHGEELYALIVDRIGDVLSVNTRQLEDNPPTMRGVSRHYSRGVCRLDDRLLILLDITKLLRVLEGERKT